MALLGRSKHARHAIRHNADNESHNPRTPVRDAGMHLVYILLYLTLRYLELQLLYQSFSHDDLDTYDMIHMGGRWRALKSSIPCLVGIYLQRVPGYQST